MPSTQSTHFDLLRMISRANSFEDLNEACARLVTKLGFPFFALLAATTREKPARARLILGNTPADCLDDLAQLHEAWLNREPPRPPGATLPFCWHKHLRALKCGSPPSAGKLSRSLTCGASAIVTSSLRSLVIMSLWGPDELPDNDNARDQLLSHTHLFASIAVDAWERVEKRRSSGQQPQKAGTLTRRERECLTLAAEGETSTTIAARLGISKRTAAFHVDRAIRKLHVHSRAAAVKQAMLTGQITPQLSDANAHIVVADHNGTF
jgi:DNA-binding CsgD family transcriptional regulator